jgi:hypothetical protein
MSMSPMGADDIILMTNGRTGTDGNRFLSEIGMKVAPDKPLTIELNTSQFKAANYIDLSEHFKKQLSADGRRRFG